jgi:hypothetical protein
MDAPSGALAAAGDDAATSGLFSLCALAGRVVDRRAALQRGVAAGYAAAVAALRCTQPGPGIMEAMEARLPDGMLEALCIAGELNRPEQLAALDHHYQRTGPAQLAQQLRAHGPPGSHDAACARLFSTKLSLGEQPRLAAGLERLFGLVADAGLDCKPTLGAATPDKLLSSARTLGGLYATAHFGRSMPMLYGYLGDLAVMPDGDLTAWVDARYAGPLLHELAHLHPLDPLLVPAPGNLHEALAAWLGSEALPEQMVPRAPSGEGDPGGLDALPGGPWFAAVGAWVARACSSRGAIRAQAGAADLRDLLGPECAEALRLFGWLGHLDTSAPHLLADTFAAGRWWKLIDLHRDRALAREFHRAHVEPLLSARPPPLGTGLTARWAAALDALQWSDLPAWDEEPNEHDHALAARAVAALTVRAKRVGLSFRAQRTAPPPAGFVAKGPSAESRRWGTGPLSLDVRACLLRSGHIDIDAAFAPQNHPYPPSIAALFSRKGIDECRLSAE